jgi:hypothetical protein
MQWNETTSSEILKKLLNIVLLWAAAQLEYEGRALSFCMF